MIAITGIMCNTRLLNVLLNSSWVLQNLHYYYLLDIITIIIVVIDLWGGAGLSVDLV